MEIMSGSESAISTHSDISQDESTVKSEAVISTAKTISSAATVVTSTSGTDNGSGSGNIDGTDDESADSYTSSDYFTQDRTAPTPAPRLSLRTLSASYSTEFETGSATPVYSDNFETAYTHSHPDSARHSTENLISAKTTYNYSQSFESYASSGQSDDAYSDVTDHPKSTSSSESYRSLGTESTESSTSEYGSDSESSNRTARSEDNTDDYSDDVFTYDEVSEGTKQAEEEALQAFLARKLRQRSGSGSSTHTPRPPSTPRPSIVSSANGGAPRVLQMIPRTPRTPRISPPQPTPRATLTDSHDFCRHKLQVLKERLSNPPVEVREPPVPKRWWSQIASHSIDDYGISIHAFTKLKMDAFMKQMQAVAKAEVHKPKKCLECRELAAESQLQGFVKHKFAVVSERHIQEKMKNPEFFMGDVVTRLGEHLRAMPKIHANTEETLEQLMLPLRDNYIMMKRVSLDVADEAARVCGAPTDREQFWKYYFKKFHESDLYAAHTGKRKASVESPVKIASEPSQKTEVMITASDKEDRSKGNNKLSDKEHWQDQDVPLVASTAVADVMEDSLPYRSREPSLGMQSRPVSTVSSTTRSSQDSYHANICNIADLQLAEDIQNSDRSIEHNNMINSMDERYSHSKSSDTRSMALNNNVYSLNELQSLPSMSEDSGSYRPNNIYDIDDL